MKTTHDFLAETFSVALPYQAFQREASQPFFLNQGKVTSTPLDSSFASKTTFLISTRLIQSVTFFFLFLSFGLSVPALAQPCPCTIFQPTDVPEVPLVNAGAPIQVGVKFRSNIAGFIKGIRYYKGLGFDRAHDSQGNRVAQLYTIGGVLLEQINFTVETVSGWQETTFARPVPITANTIYVASYHTNSGDLPLTDSFFVRPIINGPLEALADTTSGNGLYLYTDLPAFPTTSFQGNNLWVDVVFVTAIAPDLTPPTVEATSPADGTKGVALTSSITVTFNEKLDPATITNTTIQLRDAANVAVAATLQYNANAHRVTLTPSAPLQNSTSYTIFVKGGATNPTIRDLAGNALQNDATQKFTTLAPVAPPLTEGPGGPILVITNTAFPFSRYPMEMLRAEGLNEFKVLDISLLTTSELNKHDVVIVGEIPVNAAQVQLLSTWVDKGGTLITFRPDADLLTLAGLTYAGGTLSEGYLLMNTATGPGVGLVGETIQFHSTADYYTLTGATSLATLYSNTNTATIYPAVTSRNVGIYGGKVVAFTFDLARSVIYLRQGNPAWSGDKRDGIGTIVHSQDLFFGAKPNDVKPDWVNLDKAHIPQADEQQRLLVNIILKGNFHRKPLPRFWYLPRKVTGTNPDPNVVSGFKAAMVMTGDDHGNGIGLTAQFFERFKTMSPSNTPQAVKDWLAVRGTSFVFPRAYVQTPKSYQEQGFEISLHLNNGCSNWTPSSLETNFNQQLVAFTSAFPTIIDPRTHRTHCVPWCDWTSGASVQVKKGMRLDANYFYWPTATNYEAGIFSGSGIPMRFANLNGSLIDSYQIPTHLRDDTGQDIPSNTTALLSKAIGPEGYYGVFCTNMHTDRNFSLTLAESIVNISKAHGVPVVSSLQMLQWLDGHDNSFYDSISWRKDTFRFSITVADGAHNLLGMLPTNIGTDNFNTIKRNGNPIAFTMETIKGISYAFFPAEAGRYEATYTPILTTLSGKVTLQGRPAAPNARWIVPLQVDLYVPGETTPTYQYAVTTNNMGEFTLPNIPTGIFNIAVKHAHALQRVKSGITLTTGMNTVDFGTLIEGDANNDNIIDIFDYSILSASFGKFLGDAGYDARADFNSNDEIDVFDFSLLSLNYDLEGGTIEQ